MPSVTVSASLPLSSGEPPVDPDRALLAAVGQGSERALEDLYRRHGEACFGYLLRRLDGDRPAAEDLLQDLMLAVWRGAGSYRGEGEVRPWLMGIAHRLWLQELRRRGRRPQLVDEADALAAMSDGPGEVGVGSHGPSGSSLPEALAALPDPLRQALDLTFGQGLRLQDAARILGLPLGTVKSRLFRARQQLRHFLENER